MKKILLIGTGGTIASRQTEKGLAPGLSAGELLACVPEAGELCHADAVQPFSVDSTNIAPHHWLRLARIVEKAYSDYDGFVLCHGTDTMAYTAAALSYLIQNSPKPIVITGSQKPIGQEDTDARTNLLDSLAYAADPASHGVRIVFDGKVILGTRAKKQRAKSYNAFTSVNFPQAAVLQDRRIIRYLPDDCAGPVRFYHALDEAVCLLKLTPGMNPAILRHVLAACDCLVMESFGVGGIPAPLLEELRAGLRGPQGAEKLVVMTTQVMNEGSDMTVYEVGKTAKQELGLFEAYDMTLEAVLTKCMWMLANGERSREALHRAFYTPVDRDILFHD